MGVIRWLGKRLMTTLFRELHVIDRDNIPDDRGAVLVSWHPCAMYDQILTQTSLNLDLIDFDGLIDSEEELESIAKAVANGGKVMVFPEGETHDSPQSVEVRDCASKILLRSREIADLEPVLVPIGIHYSERYRFRERVAITVERPAIVPDEIEVEDLSELISKEISRASQSRSTWQERRLIWNVRSIVHAERVRRNPDLELRTTFDVGVLQARRVRAAWEWLSQNDSEKCLQLEEETKSHLKKLKDIGLKPRHLDARPNMIGMKGLLKSVWWTLFAWSFMLGFVTWSAIIGSIPPYLVVKSTDKFFAEKLSVSEIGQKKYHIALIIYPIWWLISALGFTWVLIGDASPLHVFEKYSLTLAFLFSLPSYVVFPLMLWWMPTAGKLQIKLYTRGTIAWRRLKLWVIWRNPKFDWDRLISTQNKIAEKLTNIGNSLILPGDADWVDPDLGLEDWTRVFER
ncbi:MAG: hypothetical protein QGI21_00050 [Candidatus Poseidoniaceae archaeon]|jgi:hypothetical protein|nr:hypothetical protein [Candidatus Poseidoniaceae archaeon]